MMGYFLELICCKSISWEGLMEMHYIYVYTNKINNHKYVGQTNNLQRRIREHRSCAFNKNSSSYNDLIHQKMREYGEDNFEIEVLEQIYSDDIDLVNQQERYWIKKLNSFRGNGQGYNSDLGGSRKYYSSVISPEDLKQIKQDISEGVNYYELEQKYNVSASFISSINHGVYFKDDKAEYPLYKYYKDDDDYSELIDLLANSDLSLAEIARQLELGYSTVKKINAGTLRKGLYPTYPIRKHRSPKAIKIIDLLKNSEYSIQEIAQIIGYSEETIRRINRGETNHQKDETYPLRNL